MCRNNFNEPFPKFIENLTGLTELYIKKIIFIFSLYISNVLLIHYYNILFIILIINNRQLCYNNIYGPIPEFIGKLTKLQYL